MTAASPRFMMRASAAFASFAATVALAVLSVLALALGTVEDSKAESASILLNVMKIEDPALDVHGSFAVDSLPARAEESSRLVSISRQPVTGLLAGFADAKGPTQEWMGVSKVAFPLLIKDLVAGPTTQSPRVMTGRPVGAK